MEKETVSGDTPEFHNGGQIPAYGNEMSEVALLLRALKDVVECGADESGKMRQIAADAIKQHDDLFAKRKRALRNQINQGQDLKT